MVVRISDKTQNYSKVTKLLVKPLTFESESLNKNRFKSVSKNTIFRIKEIKLYFKEATMRYLL